MTSESRQGLILIARVWLMTLLAALSVLALSSPARPSPAAAPGQATPTFRSETNLVLVRFQMTPKKGGSNDLRPEDIELREDGVVQKIAVFQGGQLYPQSIPVEINLLFDDISRGEPIRRGMKPSWMISWKLDMSVSVTGYSVSVTGYSTPELPGTRFGVE